MLIAVAAILSGFCTTGLAGQPSEEPDPAAKSEALWEIGAGVAFARTPNYPAAIGSRNRAVPLPIVIYRGRFLRAGDGSLVSGEIFKSKRLELDISLNGSFDADSDDVDIRRGMPDLGYLFELGPELEWRLSDPSNDSHKLKLEVPLRAAFSIESGKLSSRGWVFNPELELELYDRLGPGTEISLSIAASWASESLMDYFYQVDAPFAGPERALFDARDGYMQTTLGIGFSQRKDKRFLFAGILHHDYSNSANRSSPLFEANDGWSFYAGAAWSLWQSKRRAPAR